MKVHSLWQVFVSLEWSLILCSFKVAVGRFSVEQQQSKDGDDGFDIWTALLPSQEGPDLENEISNYLVRVEHSSLSNVLSNARSSGEWPLKVSFGNLARLTDDTDSENDSSKTGNSDDRNLRMNPNPNEAVGCDLVPSNVVSPSLADKFPQVIILAGSCANGLRATLVYNTEQEGTLSVSFYSVTSVGSPIFSVRQDLENDGPGALKDPNEYRIQKFEGFDRSRGNVEFLEPPPRESPNTRTRRVHQDSSQQKGQYRNLQDLMYSTFTTYRIAVATTEEFSVRVTGVANPTAAQVHTQVAAIMARVNAVYMREMGVYFQLVDNNDDLYCLEGETYCEDWVNESASTALNQVDNYIADAYVNAGITPDSYDLTHLFQAPGTDSTTSFSGSGIAYSPAICNSGNFANGVSGCSAQFCLQGAGFLGILVHEIGTYQSL